MAKNNNPADKAKQSVASPEIGLLGSDTRFEGTIRFEGTLRIDGAVVGNIESQPGSGSVLIINREASVVGDIVSDTVMISGQVEGVVHARERVELFKAGDLKGDIFTADVMIEAGAIFAGYCHMDEEPPTRDKQNLRVEAPVKLEAERVPTTVRQTVNTPASKAGGPPGGRG